MLYITKLLQVENRYIKEDLAWGVSKLRVRNLDKSKDVGTYKCIVKVDDKKYTDELTVTRILGKHH